MPDLPESRGFAYTLDASALLDVYDFKEHADAVTWAWTAAEHLQIGWSQFAADEWASSMASTNNEVLRTVTSAADELRDGSVVYLVQHFWRGMQKSPSRCARMRGVAETLLWYQLQAAESAPERRRILQAIALAAIRAIYRGIDTRAVFALLARHAVSRSQITTLLAESLASLHAQLKALAHSVERHAPPARVVPGRASNVRPRLEVVIAA